MKILLVDDEIEKIRNIMNNILDIEGIEENMIEYTIEVSEAKRKLQHNEYDLLILDLNMPEKLPRESEDNAGADFVDEIMGVNSYYKPVEIVVLTAYDICEKNFVEGKNRNAFIMLRYDEASMVWIEKLKSIVEYRLIYSKQKEVIVVHRYDYAIITAVPVETNAVKALADNWERIIFDDDTNIYYSTEFKDDEKRKNVVTVQLPDMGMVSSSTVTMNICRHFKPKYIFIVGIAAGIGEYNFGDIIIPSEIWNYSSGKYVDESGNLDFIPDPKVIQLDAKILEIVKQDYSQELFKIRQKWPVKGTGELSVYNSPLACGTAVVANKEIIKEHIISHFRKSGGIDMESYGVFFAARFFCDSKPIPICVKSISDFADLQKDDSNQPYASYTSSNFVKYLIMNVL